MKRGASFVSFPKVWVCLQSGYRRAGEGRWAARTIPIKSTCAWAVLSVWPTHCTARGTCRDHRAWKASCPGAGIFREANCKNHSRRASLHSPAAPSPSSMGSRCWKRYNEVNNWINLKTMVFCFLILFFFPVLKSGRLITTPQISSREREGKKKAVTRKGD